MQKCILPHSLSLCGAVIYSTASSVYNKSSCRHFQHLHLGPTSPSINNCKTSSKRIFYSYYKVARQSFGLLVCGMKNMLSLSQEAQLYCHLIHHQKRTVAGPQTNRLGCACGIHGAVRHLLACLLL